MKIEFRKITHEPKEFVIELEGCKLKGMVWKSDRDLFSLKAHLSGDIRLICDVSGEEYTQALDEELNIKASDGIYASQGGDQEFDVVEFFDGMLDFHELLRSELESIRLDYHRRYDIDK